MIALAHALEGQLTATLHGSDADIAVFADLVDILERKAGRLIVNGYPTGVEVCHAMVHGGPYPATSDSRLHLRWHPGYSSLRSSGVLPGFSASRVA